LSFYQKFEHAVVLVLVGLIAVVVIAAVWSLAVKILFGLVLSGRVDPTDPAVFQAVFGMIFTVIIALEFKRSLQIVTERRDNMAEWGAPSTGPRLRKMVESLAAFARNAKRRDARRLSVAIAEWESDLDYLKRTYYVGRYDFVWPDTAA
jgi:hypothetical protein